MYNREWVREQRPTRRREEEPIDTTHKQKNRRETMFKGPITYPDRLSLYVFQCSSIILTRHRHQFADYDEEAGSAVEEEGAAAELEIPRPRPSVCTS